MDKLQTQNADSHLRHLQAEFARIDIVLRREVRRWGLAGQEPNDDYRGLYITQLETQQLLDRPFGYSWGQLIELPAEETAAFQQALTATTQQIEALTQALTTQGQTPRLLQLAQAFGLDRTALDILLLCLAPAFDTRYERVYGYLQDNVTRRRPSVRLVLDVLGAPGMAQFQLATYLSREAPLFKNEVLEYIVEAPPANAYWLNQTLNVDETVVAWLRGHYAPNGTLKDETSLVHPKPNETDQLLAGEGLQHLRQTANLLVHQQALSESPLIVFYGVDATAQEAAARCLAAETQLPLLVIRLGRVIGEHCPPRQAVQLALRDARLTGAIALLNGWDACLDEERRAAPAVLALLYNHPGLVIMAGQKPWQPGGVARQRAISMQEFGLPQYTQRLALWRHYLAGWAACQPSDEELTNLAGQFALTSGQIRDAVAAARDLARQTGGPMQVEALFDMARRYSNPRLSALARKVTPRYTWQDIVLPVDERAKLAELVTTVRHRPKVLEAWGVGQKLAASSGVMVLFAGPPGTGKTMAAEVVASDLKLDLYKIELSSVVSKYIGETEKNLERIFIEAANSNAILFFDEADAIFGKRAEVKDAHDRYANIEVAYLLQRMELYDGITILATNLRSNLDEAFARRFYRTVEFPFPKREDRVRIWQTLFPPAVKQAPDLDFEWLARRFELAGGNIRNIIYSATFMAANDGEVVTMAHLLHGARRELQKMGRLVNEEDFALPVVSEKQVNRHIRTKG